MYRRGYADDPSELSTHAVLKREIPWDTYLTARLISDRDLQLIKRYDKAPKEQQAQLLKEVRTRPDSQPDSDQWHFRVGGPFFQESQTPQYTLHCIEEDARRLTHSFII